MNHVSSTPDAAQLMRMMDAMQIGWWTADFDKQTIECSDAIAALLDLKKGEASFSDFLNMVKPENLNAIRKAFVSITAGGDFDHTFPVMIGDDEVWMRSKMIDRPGNDGNVARGTLQIIRRITPRDRKLSIEKREAMAETQSNIYNSLLAFLGTEDISPILMGSLQQILKQFDCSHIGMFEYNHQRQTQRCTYTVANGQVPEMVDMDESPIDITPWLSGRMFSRQPVMVNDLGELPEMAAVEKAMLSGGHERQRMRDIRPRNQRKCLGSERVR